MIILCFTFQCFIRCAFYIVEHKNQKATRPSTIYSLLRIRKLPVPSDFRMQINVPNCRGQIGRTFTRTFQLSRLPRRQILCNVDPFYYHESAFGSVRQPPLCVCVFLRVYTYSHISLNGITVLAIFFNSVFMQSLCIDFFSQVHRLKTVFQILIFRML